ncbi:hypothetical protein [Epilithonimonas arachidiradicis]|uniref:Uncharacterized protein n=1 Tax=Epilithonimonas arachidiradicis TaxID=1617282 RepID=A0A420DDP5_9FLAO|nr:hypothetical protein [Epilithonimonas arachidiradicis]RKE90001.1 hypothetical protein BXY58_0586 [Epilithonimonas arachidiradicis]GGG46999.1 hypothetical protein GCM10007332_05610 [Epilithonimonas arachidiradicis]
MATREQLKIRIKNKIKELQEKEDELELDELIAEIYLIIYDDFLEDKIVTGVCPSGGGALTQGKIIQL